MIVLSKLVNADNVKNKLEEATLIYKGLSKTLDKDDINKVVENMAKGGDEELAIALGSINENIQINEYIVSHVSSDGDVSKRQDKKSRAREAAANSTLSLARRRELARRSARTRKANPAKAKEAEEKRQQARKKRTAMGVKDNG